MLWGLAHVKQFQDTGQSYLLVVCKTLFCWLQHLLGVNSWSHLQKTNKKKGCNCLLSRDSSRWDLAAARHFEACQLRRTVVGGTIWWLISHSDNHLLLCFLWSRNPASQLLRRPVTKHHKICSHMNYLMRSKCWLWVYLIAVSNGFYFLVCLQSEPVNRMYSPASTCHLFEQVSIL